MNAKIYIKTIDFLQVLMIPAYKFVSLSLSSGIYVNPLKFEIFPYKITV